MGQISRKLRAVVARQIITDVLDDAVIAGRISSHRIKGIELVNGGRKKDLSDFVSRRITSLRNWLMVLVHAV